MKKLPFRQMGAFALALLFVFFASCEKENDVFSEDSPTLTGKTGRTAIGTFAPSPASSLCGNPEMYDLRNNSGQVVGTVTITNDANNLYVDYQTSGSWVLEQTLLYVGACNAIPNIGSYMYQTAHNPRVSQYTVTVPLTGLDECYCIEASAEVQDMANCPITVNFDVDPSGNPILSGTELTNQFAAWGIANISVQNGNSNHPDKGIIFNSAAPTGGDFDLGTPNNGFGGPGIGAGGAPGMPGQNALPFGNLMIIAENDIDNNSDGRVDNPDDEAAGGYITFEFTTAVTVDNLVLVDVDQNEQGGSVALMEQLTGQTTSIPVPNLGDNSVQRVWVNMNGVTEFTTHFISSGGIAEVNFCPEIPATASIQYCTQSCESCELEPGDYRTQTQGGWGARPNGNNPGVYLHNNFPGAFPTGLQVGCNFTITLTSASAVTNFLPEGGPASALSQNFLNPTNTNNVLSGQVTALTLSVTFDQYDPSFGSSSTLLRDLVVANGPFQGWTVGQLLQEGNRILGGCPSTFTPSQINDAISSVNENFVDGTMVGNFLLCPDDVQTIPTSGFSLK